MNKGLFITAITKFFSGLAIVSLLLFLSAGTFRYPQARLLLLILFVPMFFAGLIMMKVQEDRKVIDTGRYGIVRHPMYSATVVLFLSMPLVLGSVISFLIMLFYIPLIVRRIRNEERVLEAGLEGYREYEERVRYRLIPHLW